MRNQSNIISCHCEAPSWGRSNLTSRRGLARRSFSGGGFTLVELLIGVSASLIVVLVAGVLLESGQRSWARAFCYANSKAQLDALGATISFGQYGRQSNKTDYKLYEVASGPHFNPVDIPANPEQVITGQAVEFHYWDQELTRDILDTSINGTAYALFYLDDDKLKLDTGPYPPGGVDAAGNLSGASVSTVVLAENVVSLEFNHTTRSIEGKGKGCVRMTLTLRDPVDKSLNTVTAATLMRNVWP